MSWIFILLALIILSIVFFYSKKSIKKRHSLKDDHRTEFMHCVRTQWKELRVKPEDCMLITNDYKVDRNSPTYTMNNDNETLWQWLNKNPRQVDLINVASTKIVCIYKADDNITKEFSTTVDMDKTVLEFKLRIQDYICIYTTEGSSEEENYVIDLEFLDEPIDFTKFK